MNKLTSSKVISLSIIAIFAPISYFVLFFTRPKLTEKETSNNSDINFEQIGPRSNNYVLPEGDQRYNVSHGMETKGPKMSQIVYAPLSFKQGETQKIKIVFPEKEVVGSVVVFITTDNKENQKVSFTKDSKTNTWTGEWIPEDTIKSRYSVKIIAVGSGGEYNNTMYFL